MNRQQHELAMSRMDLQAENEGRALGQEIMSVIERAPVLSLFPSAFVLSGHPRVIYEAVNYVGRELHRIAQSN